MVFQEGQELPGFVFVRLGAENAEKNSVGLEHGPMDSKMSSGTSELFLLSEALTTAFAAISSFNGRAFPLPAAQQLPYAAVNAVW